jgi:hypothetical protein
VTDEAANNSREPRQSRQDQTDNFPGGGLRIGPFTSDLLPPIKCVTMPDSFTSVPTPRLQAPHPSEQEPLAGPGRTSSYRSPGRHQAVPRPPTRGLPGTLDPSVERLTGSTRVPDMPQGRDPPPPLYTGKVS